MRYHSGDYNCCIDTCEQTLAVSNTQLERASICVKHPKLVTIRLEPRKNEFIIRSRLSNEDICSFLRSDLDQVDELGLDLSQLNGIRVKLLQDIRPDNEDLRPPDNAFQVNITQCTSEPEGTQITLHADAHCVLNEVLSDRKRQDERELTEFMRKQLEAYKHFEAEVKAQAETLSHLMIRSDRQTSKKSERSKSSRRLSGNSSQSNSSSTSSNTPRKGRSSKDTPKRSATTPLPKPALVPPQRKTSLASIGSKNDGSQASTQPKRVMFCEEEPTRIDAPTNLDLSDVEDDLTSKQTSIPDEELFEMDETATAGTRGVHDSVRMPPRTCDYKHDTAADWHNDRHEDTYDTTATSLPKAIKKTTPPAPAPLSSIKDVPFMSSPRMNQSTPTLDDLPPKGVSRKNMWKQAVTDSLRMSGLLLPSMTAADDIDQNFMY